MSIKYDLHRWYAKYEVYFLHDKARSLETSQFTLIAHPKYCAKEKPLRNTNSPVWVFHIIVSTPWLLVIMLHVNFIVL